MQSILNQQTNFYITLANIFLLLLMLFYTSLLQMVATWGREEYSHGYLIPLISLWLIWESRDVLAKLQAQGHWGGFVLMLLGLVFGLMGELSSLFTISQYAFLVAILGLCVASFGWQSIRILWFPLAYLVFMIPLPTFLYNNLSSYLQLISSGLGVAVIRLFGISVFLEGNVIDLGSFQLQVVEACSGLRYLFPLTSFGFLCAYFFRAKFWMRIIVFLSTLPITVLMNSFRIGVIGVLVDHWGKAQAEGFLHDFEGWVIFIGCLGILLLEMWTLSKLFMPDKAFSEVFVVGVEASDITPPVTAAPVTNFGFLIGPNPLLAAGVVLLLALPISWYIGERQEFIPERTRFSSFPLKIQDWQGTEVGMGQEFVTALKFDDYIVANYVNPQNNLPINLYIAYYASQRQGASVHSPKSCIPGDGWLISDFTQKPVPGLTSAGGTPFWVNHAIISKKDQKQLVYYWFQQRGRVINNEYLLKWYLFWDALTQQRTDGALVRLVLPLDNFTSEEQGEKALQQFTQAVAPLLNRYIPN